jgi:hypothetical protein
VLQSHHSLLVFPRGISNRIFFLNFLRECAHREPLRQANISVHTLSRMKKSIIVYFNSILHIGTPQIMKP